MGIPFENTKFKHKCWVVSSKFNVALVEDTKTGKDVVLKLVESRTDYDHELGFLRYLNNSNASRFVVELKDSIEPIEGSSEQRYCIVMEELGDNLVDFLSNNPDLNKQNRIALALNLVQATEALHHAGVMHCDLKPHQLCLTRRGIIFKLIDFDSARKARQPVAPLDRFTIMYTAPEVVRAAAAGELSSFVPTKGIDLWALGIMLAQIFHPNLEPVFRNDEEAKEILLGEPMAFIALRIRGLGGIFDAVEALLQFNEWERWSASQVLKEPIFQTGAYTLMNKVNQGQEKLLAGQATLAEAIKATQRMIVEYGDTTVPRLAVLVPCHISKHQLNIQDYFKRLASETGAVKFYDLFLLCEGCTLFPSTACSCGKVLNNPVRVQMPGAILKKLTPVLKAAALLYTTISIASNATGVQLPYELPGVNNLIQFAEAVNAFVEAADNKGAEYGGQEEVSATSETRAYGPAYAALAALLSQSGVAPLGNTCQGLLKVADQTDGRVYWVCKAHAFAHTDRLLNASTAHQDQESSVPLLPVSSNTKVRADEIAHEYEAAKQNVIAQEVALTKLWTEGYFVAASRQASELVVARSQLAGAAEGVARFEAEAAASVKAAKAKEGFQGKPKSELNKKLWAKSCQVGCGYLFAVRKLGFDKHQCRGCGIVVCANCSPPPKVLVVGYTGPKRLCATCKAVPGLIIK